MRSVRSAATLWSLCCLLGLAGVAERLEAQSVVVNVSCGYLFDAAGTSPANRLAAGTLCVLVADLAGDGFDPLNADWVSGDDVLVTVSDPEYPAGTKGFDLAPGTTEAGLFSRSLTIHPAQFAGRTQPVAVALRWFPAYRAAQVNLAADKPLTGTPYGEFSRVIPLYPAAGSVRWSLPMTAGGNLTFDPLATAEFGGVDPAGSALARWRVLLNGRAEELRLSPSLPLAVQVSFRGAPGRRYEVERSGNLSGWIPLGTPVADVFGACGWQDAAPLAGRAFYRIRGPLP
jgi:hypothetical protein